MTSGTSAASTNQEGIVALMDRVHDSGVPRRAVMKYTCVASVRPTIVATTSATPTMRAVRLIAMCILCEDELEEITSNLTAYGLKFMPRLLPVSAPGAHATRAVHETTGFSMCLPRSPVAFRFPHASSL